MNIKILSAFASVLLSTSLLLSSCQQTPTKPNINQEQNTSENKVESSIKIGEIETDSNGINYRLYTEKEGKKYYTIVGIGSYQNETLTISDSFQDLPVERIAESAFRNSKLKSVTVSSNIQKIDDAAFENCDRLIEITLGNGVTVIGRNAFASCDVLETVTFGTSLQKLGDSAFLDCIALKTLLLPDSLKTIQDRAFWGCIALETLRIPNNLTSIGTDLFFKCVKLNPTKDAAEDEEIGDLYLGNEENPYLLLLSIKDVKATSYTVREETKYIGEKVFAECKNLTEIHLPASILSISESAFQNCTLLASIHFGGTAELWKNITKDYLWDYGTGNYSIICSDTTVAKDADFRAIQID